MAQHPNSVSFAEARRVLEAYGWHLRRASGSHHIFQNGGRSLIIPHRRPHILMVYIRQILSATEGNDEPGDGT